ncbi:conserved protein, unknown function [Hepatocystis sp. ex Piliocolobus tephrosceles]|nr:conserved protein, unknown function [Hepatocystis sp. ex Piliocolobus tephrosceles]
MAVRCCINTNSRYRCALYIPTLPIYTYKKGMFNIYKSKNFLTTILKKYYSTNLQSSLSNDNLKKIKEFRKVTNLSISICKNVLSQNDYNIEKSINFIFENLNQNYEKKNKKLTEGYYCIKSESMYLGVVKLVSYNDVISESIFFKQLIINICNKLLSNSEFYFKRKNFNIEKELIANYIHLFYKDNNKISVDKELKNVEHKDLFKQVYFNKKIYQLIKYTSYILNDFIFLKKYFLLAMHNFNDTNLKNIYVIKKKYYHKELKVDDYVLCKGFSFVCLSIKYTEKDIIEKNKILLDKFASLISTNILIYKSTYCSIKNDLNIQNCFGSPFLNCVSNTATTTTNMPEINEENKNKDITNDDYLDQQIQSFDRLAEYLDKSDFKKLKNMKRNGVTFHEFIATLEQELSIKIYFNIMYSMLNDKIVIL